MAKITLSGKATYRPVETVLAFLAQDHFNVLGNSEKNRVISSVLGNFRTSGLLQKMLHDGCNFYGLKGMFEDFQSFLPALNYICFGDGSINPKFLASDCFPDTDIQIQRHEEGNPNIFIISIEENPKYKFAFILSPDSSEMRMAVYDFVEGGKADYMTLASAWASNGYGTAFQPIVSYKFSN